MKKPKEKSLPVGRLFSFAGQAFVPSLVSFASKQTADAVPEAVLVVIIVLFVCLIVPV